MLFIMFIVHDKSLFQLLTVDLNCMYTLYPITGMWLWTNLAQVPVDESVAGLLCSDCDNIHACITYLRQENWLGCVNSIPLCFISPCIYANTVFLNIVSQFYLFAMFVFVVKVYPFWTYSENYRFAV